MNEEIIISEIVINVWGDVMRTVQKKNEKWKIEIIDANTYQAELSLKCFRSFLKDIL